MNGRYVGFEGVEGAGKSTVVQAVSDRLTSAGENVVVVREPGGTWVGEEIRRLLLHSDALSDWTEAALFAASRAELVRRVVAPELERGAWVLSDRTYYSSLAYQGGGRQLGVEAVRTLNEQVLGGVVPDLVVLLAVDPVVGFARETDRDRIGSEGLEFQRRVAETYDRIAAEDVKVRRVDTAGSVEDVVADVMTVLGYR
ncbi:MAG TPA: dTMP kinase [Acidimicrobiia bacterium]|nr:dTMP kinase [Acidimicrobiia bacterium]